MHPSALSCLPLNLWSPTKTSYGQCTTLSWGQCAISSLVSYWRHINLLIADDQFLRIKRDRSTIVDHSVAYVKSLHECIKNLQEKRLEILKSNACSLSGVQIKGTPKQKKQKQNNSVAYNYVSSPDLRKEVLNVAFLKSCAAREESESDTLGEERCIEKIEVHMDWPHQIVIEITCRPHPHIQSQIMKEMERLEMDVSSCSITKFHNHLVCVIILKVSSHWAQLPPLHYSMWYVECTTTILKTFVTGSHSFENWKSEDIPHTSILGRFYNESDACGRAIRYCILIGILHIAGIS